MRELRAYRVPCTSAWDTCLSSASVCSSDICIRTDSQTLTLIHCIISVCQFAVDVLLVQLATGGTFGGQQTPLV